MIKEYSKYQLLRIRNGEYKPKLINMKPRERNNMRTFGTPAQAGINFMLDGKPYSTLDMSFFLSINLNEEPKELGCITVGYLRTGDHVGSQGNEDMTVWYQDGTKWTINKSWFE